MGKSGGREPRTDFSALLAELKDEYASNGSEIIDSTETAARKLDEPVKDNITHLRVVPFADGFPDSDEEWQRAKSDVTVKYALYHGVIHDKCCPCIQDVPAYLVEFVKSYPSDGVQCGECAVRTYIRNGAEDMGNFEKYIAFFHRVNWKSSSIKKFYVDHDIRTRIDTDVMTVWYKEDTWKIKSYPGTARVDLLHNNYIIQNNQRYFTNGFHSQAKCIDMSNAVSCIYSYDYHRHLQPESVTKRKTVHAVNPPAADPMPKPQEEQRIASVTKPVQKKPSLRIRLKTRIRRFMLRYLRLERTVRIDGLSSIEYAGYPKSGSPCFILWNAEDGNEHWIIAVYSQKKQSFHATIGSYQVRIAEDKVLAWKALDLKSVSSLPTDGTTGINIIT